jgi:hypothetical protein
MSFHQEPEGSTGTGFTHAVEELGRAACPHPLNPAMTPLDRDGELVPWEAGAEKERP